MFIKKGDMVKVISGVSRGKTGTVLKVFSGDGRLTIEGMNLYKKRVRPKRQGQKGETVLVPRAISASKVMLVCQNCKDPARVGYRREGKVKNRYCKKCKANT